MKCLNLYGCVCVSEGTAAVLDTSCCPSTMRGSWERITWSIWAEKTCVWYYCSPTTAFCLQWGPITCIGDSFRTKARSCVSGFHLRCAWGSTEAEGRTGTVPTERSAPDCTCAWTSSEDAATAPTAAGHMISTSLVWKEFCIPEECRISWWTPFRSSTATFSLWRRSRSDLVESCQRLMQVCFTGERSSVLLVKQQEYLLHILLLSLLQRMRSAWRLSEASVEKVHV